MCFVLDKRLGGWYNLPIGKRTDEEKAVSFSRHRELTVGASQCQEEPYTGLGAAAPNGF